MFPSPIYGASFKLYGSIDYNSFLIACFRPLYTGLVSNLMFWKDGKEYEEMFPSPIYGASFKLVGTVKAVINRDLKFPSPIYGASFKRIICSVGQKEVYSFRPLYTGLVSN